MGKHIDTSKVSPGRRLLLRNTAFQYGLQIAKYLFPFITLPYLARVLGPEPYAIRAYVLAAMTFVQVFLEFGFNSYGAKIVAEREGSGEDLSSITSTIVFLRLALAIASLPVLVAATVNIPIMAANAVYVAVSFIGVCLKSMLPDFLFQGKEDMGILTKRYVFSQTVSTILIFAVIHDSGDLILVPIFEGVASGIAFIWSWISAVRAYSVRIAWVSREELWCAFRSSSVFFVSNASSIVYTFLTTLLIGVFIENPAEISYWSLATTAIQAIQSLYLPITNSLYPHVIKRGDYSLVKKLLAIGTLVVFVGTAAFVYLSDLVMLVLGGSEYVQGSYVVALLAPVLFFSFWSIMLGNPVLAASGNARLMALSSFSSALFHVFVLVLLALTGLFSLVTVAILRSVSEFVLALQRVVFARKILAAKTTRE